MEGTLWLELWFRLLVPFEVVCIARIRSHRMSAFSSHVLGLPVNSQEAGWILRKCLSTTDHPSPVPGDIVYLTSYYDAGFERALLFE